MSIYKVKMKQNIENLSDEKLWHKIYGRLDNKTCKICKQDVEESGKKMSSLQPVPYIGSQFYNNKYQIMFIGKGTYNNDKSRGYDVFPTKQVRNLFLNDNYSFWDWVREINKSIFDNESAKEVFPYFAYSNVHKCQAVPKGWTFNDTPDYIIDENVSTNCITNAGWIYREINEIAPKNVVLFLGFQWDHYLAKLFLQNEKLIKKFNYDYYIKKSSDKDRIKYLKKRKSGDYKDDDYFIHLRDGNRRFIITNHPQGAPHEIRDEIIRIIKNNDWRKSIRWKMPK
jgi:hypothetical protein